jgi:hypothetical protein
MSFLKKLFGGGDDKAGKNDRPRKPSAAPPTAARRAPPPPAAETAATDVAGAETAAPPVAVGDAKALSRQVGSTDRAARRAAAAALLAMGDKSSMRPLMTSYVNYGDPEVLDVLRTYGSRLTPAVLRDADDLSIIGERRLRLLDMLAATADEEVLGAVRRSVGDADIPIHVRACAALIELGDLSGVDHLAHDLGLNEPTRRTPALEALRHFDHPAAVKAVASHRERYLAEAGAIPERIEVSAPRLANPEASLLQHLVQHVKTAPHSLTIITGSEAINMATARRGEIDTLLAGHNLRVTTRRAPPEEQIAELEAARDQAAADPSGRYVVFGALPAPRDRVPLPHFLTAPSGTPYTAKVIILDPHEMGVVMEWWRYVDDQAQVPTDFEVILGIATPDRSPISEEEYALYQLTPEAERDRFIRAFLAHI